MPTQSILKTVEFKLHLTSAQERTLTEWLGVCCWIYNRALEQRIKAYKRRGESSSFNTQCALLTEWRKRMERLRSVPCIFLRDSLRRLDRGFQAFFRRCKAGQKPGFPRFRSRHRYNSIEYLASGNYIGDGMIRIPILGAVRARGRNDVTGKQRLLRVMCRASGWYAQILIDTGVAIPPKVAIGSAVGIDVGLESFVTLSSGEKIENPRFFRKTQRKLKRSQQLVSRRIKGSKNRRKAVRRLHRVHERLAARRRDFSHQTARRLVNRFDLIGFENLNIKGLASGMLAKSVHDVAWSMFLRFVVCKAENAGKHAISVDPRGTSQECPGCGVVKSKGLSERIHLCPCGAFLDRDEASALVILARAARVVTATACGGNRLYSSPQQAGASRPVETGSPAPTRR